MYQLTKSILRLIIPSKLANSIRRYLYMNIRLRSVNKSHEKALIKIRKKDKIKVAFFLIHDSIWKYDGVYKLMEKDERFDPIIVVCPYIMLGEEIMLRDMNQAYNSFKEKNYNVIQTLNEETKKWLDIKKEIQPDIVFFTNPHKLTKEEYYITNFLDCLTCYVPYNFGNSHLLKMFHNQLFHNLIWILFAETEIHKQFSKEIANNKGQNVVVSGFPGTDAFLDNNYQHKNSWKKGDKNKKIIWAPHHTIDDDKSVLSFSSFLLYADFMLDLTCKYRESIQIAFKPHPLLKYKLYNLDQWGKEKTDYYYNRWNQIDNGQLEEGDYIDLFLTSDAMIHDSGSFLIEYLYTLKPVLRTDRDDGICDRLNIFGKMAYNMHYHARNEQEIIKFVEQLINNNDIMKEKRVTFLKEFLTPPFNKSASQNIFDELVKKIFAD
jgi:CDP-glycerol glycerophosphotransferase (TagB/SpsB family)